MTIERSENSDLKSINQFLNNFNLQQVTATHPTWTPLNFHVKNSKGKMIAGITAGVGYWGGLEIQTLYVEEKSRGQGIGSSLLKHTEDEARKINASIALVDTFSFQGPSFYEKHRYSQIGRVEDFPSKGLCRIYFEKRL